MKVYKTIAALFLFVFTISFISCGGGGDKDKVVKYYKSSIEFFKSDDFKRNMLDEAYTEKKQNEILKESGFESEADFEEAIKQLENDEDLIKLATEMEKVKEDIVQEETNKINEEKEKTAELEKKKEGLDTVTNTEDKDISSEKEEEKTDKKEKEEEDVTELNGKELLQSNCKACHKFNGKLVGPPYNEVIPKYNGNVKKLAKFILNPAKVDPEYTAEMPDLGLTKKQAEAIAKYLFKKVQ